jgi:hypothetical protein
LEEEQHLNVIKTRRVAFDFENIVEVMQHVVQWTPNLIRGFQRSFGLVLFVDMRALHQAKNIDEVRFGDKEGCSGSAGPTRRLIPSFRMK